MAAILGTKQLELLRMMIPRMTTVAILARSNSPYSQRQLDELQAAVRTLGLQSIVVSIAAADEIDEAFTEFAREKVDAFVAGASRCSASKAAASPHLRHGTGCPAFLTFASSLRPAGL
jgi:ABC-type uncharacterized transport system substrate-binding protein